MPVVTGSILSMDEGGIVIAMVSIVTGSVLSMDECAVVIAIMSIVTGSVLSMDEDGIVSYGVHFHWFSLVHGWRWYSDV